MVIPYQTIKFKSANTFAMAIWDPTTKINSRQYFQLYSNVHNCHRSGIFCVMKLLYDKFFVLKIMFGMILTLLVHMHFCKINFHG